jgi:hypothetical protein
VLFVTLGVGLNTFLLGQLDRDAYIRFGIWTVAVTGAVAGTRVANA